MVRFRKLTEDDIKQVANLEQENFKDAWSISSIRETFLQAQALIAVAEVESKIVGYCILYHVLDEGEIARIAVSNGFRRKGIGRGILDFVSQYCVEEQVRRLLLDVREGNRTARKFYEQYGFTEDGIRKAFYDNPKEDAVLMSMTIA